MAIIGAHMLLYTPQAEALRALLRDVFRLKHVDAGDGWLIFRLPPAEIGVHPSETSEDDTSHAVSFICDDIVQTVAELKKKGVEFLGEPQDHGYGITVMMNLPGGCRVQLYEPRHPLAIEPGSE